MNKNIENLVFIKRNEAGEEPESPELFFGFLNLLKEQMLGYLVSHALELAEERIIYRLQKQGACTNGPKRNVLGMDLSYFLFCGMSEEGFLAMIVTDEIASHLGFTEPQLYEMASVNTPKILPIQIQEDPELSEKIEKEYVRSKIQHVYVVSNVIGLNGAASILYPNALKDLSTDPFVVLPVSVNGVLAFQVDEVDVKELKWILELWNQENESSMLSNDVYEYHQCQLRFFNKRHFQQKES